MAAKPEDVGVDKEVEEEFQEDAGEDCAEEVPDGTASSGSGEVAVTGMKDMWMPSKFKEALALLRQKAGPKAEACEHAVEAARKSGDLPQMLKDACSGNGLMNMTEFQAACTSRFMWLTASSIAKRATGSNTTGDFRGAPHGDVRGFGGPRGGRGGYPARHQGNAGPQGGPPGGRGGNPGRGRVPNRPMH